MSNVSSVENDLRAIEAINQRDMQFALAGDSAMMMSQWTDDTVSIPPAGAIQRGRSVIAEAFRGVENPKILAYVLDIEEVKVLGDHAYQWGTYYYSMRPPRECRDGSNQAQDNAHSPASAGWLLEDSPRNDHR